MKTRVLLILIVMLAASQLQAQSYRQRINDGNSAYRSRNFPEAGKQYSAAQEENGERVEGYYNRGNAEYRRSAYEVAAQQYQYALKRVRNTRDGISALYNLGTSMLAAADKEPPQDVSAGEAGEQAQQLRMAGYAKAIEAFKQVLKRDQDNEDARYNLVYAMKKLEQLRKQSQSGDKNKDKQQKQDQQKQDQQKQDQQKQDQQKQDQQKQDQQKQDQQKQDQQKKEQQGKQQEQQKGKPEEQKGGSEQERQMKKQQSEQILQALERQERELQKKLKEKRAVRVDVEKDW